MKYKLSIAALSAGVFIFVGASFCLAEDSSTASATEAPAAEVSAPSVPAGTPSTVAVPAASPVEAPSMSPAANEPDVLWLWGDVVAVDTQKNEITVKYLDYESDNEKEIPVAVNDKTAYENAKTLSELKAQDTVSIDYIIVDGKNVAKNISVEKPESAEPVKEAVAAAPDAPDTQPVAPASDVSAAAPASASAPDTKPQAAE